MLEIAGEHHRVEPLEARPQRHVRSQGRLSLQADQVLDRPDRRLRRALQQQLPLQCRAVELATREAVGGHPKIILDSTES